MKRMLIYTAILISTYCSVKAQNLQDSVSTGPGTIDTLPAIEIIGEFRNDTMFLRWAPNRPELWYQASRLGYLLERFDMEKETGLLNLSSRDTTIVFPQPLSAFEGLMREKEKHTYALTMAECLYGGESYTEDGQDFGLSGVDLKNRYGFALFAADMDFSAAVAGGLGYADADNIISGNEYFYRVRPIVLDSNYAVGYTTLSAESQPIPVPYISTAIEGEGKVTLQWSRADHEAFFSGYYIERSTDGQQYERLNDLPFVGGVSREFPSSVFSYTDFVANYQPATYRIIGITPFGRTSPPSETVRLQGRDRTPCGTVTGFKLVTDEASKSVVVSWESVQCADLSAYKLLRGSEANGEFKQIGPDFQPGERLVYTDHPPSIRKKIYYRIAAVDTAGNSSVTLPKLAAFRDTLPPDVPVGLTAEIDSNGVVTLTWTENTEEDLRGYHVYRANADYHMFTLINATPVTEASFVDTVTLRTTTEEVFYKVTAVDFQGHLSSFSEALRIARPDTIPPFPPSLTGYSQDEEGIVLHWTPSRSKDVVSHEMYRSENGGPWQAFEEIDVNIAEIRDENVEAGKVYRYKIQAVDDAGLKSVDHASITIRFVDKSLPEVPVLIGCSVDDGGHIRISWNAPEEGKVLIYRSINGGPLTVIGRVTGEEEFIDRKTRSNRNYSYALKYQQPDGKKSDFTPICTPEIKE